MSPEQEQRIVEGVRDWFDSLGDLIALTTDANWNESTASCEIPAWVRTVSDQLRNTMFAPVTKNLSELKLTPYRAGFAMGIMRWGADKMARPLPEVAKHHCKKLSPRMRRRVGKIFETFLLRGGFLTRAELRRSQFIPPNFKSYVARVERESITNAAEFHRGMADGMSGLGAGTPMDRSTLATEIYFAMAIWWRAVVRMSSVTELHAWLVRILGANQVRDKERIEKICQRIGLKFRARGRPRKNPTLALPG